MLSQDQFFLLCLTQCKLLILHSHRIRSSRCTDLCLVYQPRDNSLNDVCNHLEKHDRDDQIYRQKCKAEELVQVRDKRREYGYHDTKFYTCHYTTA